jgi:hypothetical protein
MRKKNRILLGRGKMEGKTLKNLEEVVWRVKDKFERVYELDIREWRVYVDAIFNTEYLIAEFKIQVALFPLRIEALEFLKKELNAKELEIRPIDKYTILIRCIVNEYRIDIDFLECVG